MRLAALALLTLAFAAVMLHAPGPARACLVWCDKTHPVHTWLVQHHVERCTARCHAIRAVRNDDDGSGRPHVAKPAGVYPCVIHWTYNGLRWWRYHYAAGGSRNHVGLGPRGVRTCLPGQ